MKIFVTGGYGFIGSSYILQRLSEGHSVVNYDLLTYAGSKDNLKDVCEHKSLTNVKADIRNYKDVLKAMSGCDFVVHFAAESHVDNSINNSSIFVDTNVKGTQVLLEAARKLNIPRFVYVSTDEVYGDKSVGESIETDRLNPSNPYSASKASGEMLVMAYSRTYGMDTVITRCTNNFGPCQHQEKFIPMVISKSLADKKIPIYGSGLQEREWIYVADHAMGIHKALTQGESGEIYNFGSGIRLNNIQIAVRILRIMNKPLSLLSHVDDRLGHDLRYAINSDKARLKLGFRNNVNFDEGLIHTVEWYEDKILNHIEEKA